MSANLAKNLLLTVSDTQNSWTSVRFVRKFFTNFCNLELTLLYVAPRPPSWDFDEVLNPEQAELREIQMHKRQAGNRALEDAHRWLVYHACDSDKIKQKVVPARKGTLMEIINEAQSGVYDAVALGRRGIGWFSEIVEDSISHKILWHEIDFPIWVVRSPEPAVRKNVLLSVFGSEPCRRIADHVGYILQDEPAHKVTLFHVRKDGPTLTDEAERAIELSRAELVKNGFPDELIEVKVVKNKKVDEAILREAEAEKYAVVAVGRTKGQPTGMGRIFPKAVSSLLLRKLEKSALWISR